MHKWKALVLAILLVVPNATVLAAPVELAGGVTDGYKYEEYVFLSGEPIKFSGKMTQTEKTDKNQTTTTTYSFDLKSDNPNRAGKLTRKMVFVTRVTERNDKGQATTVTELQKSYKESIDLVGSKYELEDFRYSESSIIDKRPAADYYSGTIVGEKVYSVNKSKGSGQEVVVSILGSKEGYKNFWGSTETQLLDYTIDTPNWKGTYSIKSSDSKSKELQYQQNEANYTSFIGGYMKVTSGESVSKYQYDMPVLNAEVTGGVASASTNRITGELKLEQDTVPTVERLIVPKFRDTVNHWAKEDIEKLYSLDIFEESSEYFMPSLSMNRYDFTVMVMKAADIRVDAPAVKKAAVTTSEKPIFKDLNVKEKNYSYVKSAYEKRIVNGMEPDRFMPNSTLTRAQAIAILLRALGFENRAPSPGYATPFADDKLIPYWAKDPIYVAREVGLILGDNNNKVNPNRPMTRAESARLLIQFLGFLEKDLQLDYRENIILY